MSNDEKKRKKSPFGKKGMFKGASPEIFRIAKRIRSSPTLSEKKLWEFLKHGVRGLKFRRQHPISMYVVDFYCHKITLIIEVDGSIHELDSSKEYDALRQSNLELLGTTIIRFTNEEIENDFEEVENRIDELVVSLLK